MPKIHQNKLHLAAGLRSDPLGEAYAPTRPPSSNMEGREERGLLPRRAKGGKEDRADVTGGHGNSEFHQSQGE